MKIFEEGYTLPPPDKFDAYRRHFYYYQLHFFLRSDEKSKSGRLLNFLHSLYINEDDEHYRWELRKRGGPAQAQIRRPPRGMNQAEAMQEHQKILNAMPAPVLSKPWMPRMAEQQSIRCKYMLFDWMRTKNGKIWSNFNSLQRSLIVFDLHTAGMSFKEIVYEYGKGVDLKEMRNLKSLLVEEVIKEMLGIQEDATYHYASHLFFRDPIYDEFDSDRDQRFLEIRAKQHFKRAIDLIELAKAGKFNTLSLLPPIPH